MEKQRNKTVAPETFIKAWQGAKDIDGVVKATGMKLHSAQFRARIYRKKGIKLQQFAPRRGAPKLDVAKLNRLVEELTVKSNQKPAKLASSKKFAAKKTSRKPAKKRVRKHAKKK